MFSGKSLELIKSVDEYTYRGRKVLVFTTSIDERNGKIPSDVQTSKITTRFHLDKSLDAYLIERFDVYKMAQEQKPQCIFLDEAQFVSSSKILDLARIVDELNIPVICYGLKNDSNGKLFEGSETLINYADKLVEQKAMCFHCGKRKAKFNLRQENGNYVFGGPQVAIEKKYEEKKIEVTYEVVCRSCYMKVMKEVTGKNYVII
jgi:thymidine kinase